MHKTKSVLGHIFPDGLHVVDPLITQHEHRVVAAHRVLAPSHLVVTLTDVPPVATSIITDDFLRPGPHPAPTNLTIANLLSTLAGVTLSHGPAPLSFL